MFLKAIPIIMIILPLIGFFVSNETFFGNSHANNALVTIAFIVFNLPWWGKLISIVIGIFWLAASSETNQSEQ